MKKEDKDFLHIVELSIHDAAPVSVEPVTLLSTWRMRRVHANFDGRGSSIHLMGWAAYEGRVSSPLQSFDRESMTAISRSGRMYKLTGRPGNDPDALHTWNHWIRFNGGPCWEDITDEYQSKDFDGDI